MADLELRNISKSFGAKKVLENISLAAKSGEFLALLGASGSGKSTLLKIISGIEIQDAGEVLVEGKEISSKPIEKRNIGMVFQNYALFEHMNVYENIAYPLRMRKLDKKEIRIKVKDALEVVKLSAYEKRSTADLSGGEQQRVALARSIVYQPDILLLDEPLSALDRRIREQMQEEILRIQKATGITAIFVTHDQGEALALADRILLLDNGKIAEDNIPSEVYLRPGSEFAAEFIGNSNILRGVYNDGFVAGDGFKIPVEGDFKAGSLLRVIVKEENIVFAKAGAGMGKGKVVAVLFQGTTTRISLKNQDMLLNLRVLARDGMDISIGDEIGWDVLYAAAFPL